MNRILLPASPLIALLLIAVASTACTSTDSQPDLHSLYNQAASHHDQYRNPIIVIPGILGTKLTDPQTGQTVWGAFGGKAATDPRDDAGARLFALPMAEGKTLAELTDEVEPDGVLEKIRVRLLGLPIELQAYVEILMTLGAGGFRDEDFRIQGIDYGDNHFTCFQFDYDWRRDNVENARLLDAFVKEKAAYVAEQRRERWGTNEPVKFDIIAHSMGGLVLRYFLRYGDADLPVDGSAPEITWAGTEHIERAMLVGTPNAGAVDALVQLVEGRKFGPMTPRYEAAVMGTFPSVYQLLPRVRHGALVSAEGGEPLDHLDSELWKNQGWGLADPRQAKVLEQLLPDVDAATRKRVALDHLEKNLDRARRFHAALDEPSRPPAGTQLFLTAGDAIPTTRVVSFRDGKMEVVKTALGDGTVPRSSALMDERETGDWQRGLQSPITWDHVTFLFTDHLGITKDPAFTDNLLYLLLESPRSTVDPLNEN